MLCFSKAEIISSGELLNIKAIQSPAEDYADRIFSYINPRMPWRRDTFLRVNGVIAGQCKDMFLIGELNDGIISLIWYTVCGDVATYGMVSTAEKHRNKGIFGCLMRHCIEFLEHEPGLKAVYLGVSNPLARRLYEKNGWVLYINGTDNDTCIMRRLIGRNIDDKIFDAEYFKDLPDVKIRKVLRGDLPKLEALYNWTGSNCSIKDYNASIFKNTAVECQIIDLINRMEDGEGLFYCIENANGRIAGAATLYADTSEQDKMVLDFFIHDNYVKFAEELVYELINSCEMYSAKEITAYISSEDGLKADIINELSSKRRLNILTI